MTAFKSLTVTAMYQVLCGSGKRSSILWIAVIQCVFYAVVIGLSIFGAIYFSEDFIPDNATAVSADEFFLADRMYTIIGIFHLVPFVLAVILCVGVFTEKHQLVRIYIFLKIFETIINTILLQVICISIAYTIHAYYALLICGAPIVVAIWMLETVVRVNSFYIQTIGENKNTQDPT